MRDGRAPVVVGFVGLLVAMVAAVVLGTPARSPRGEQAARAFVDAWRRSLLSTFVVHSDFVRTLPDGNRLQSTTTTVQRPPADRLVVGFGSVSGRLDGKIVGCAATPAGAGTCVTSEAAPDYGAEVDGQVEGLSSYLSGPRPLYEVTEFGDLSNPCFRLDLAIDVPSPPYGDEALFCFDRATGAPSLTVVRRPEATDQTVARDIRATVAPDDLRIPDDRGTVVGSGGPPPPAAPGG